MINEKPREPLPEDFGLNNAGIKKLQNTSAWIRGIVIILLGGVIFFKLFGGVSDLTTFILAVVFLFCLFPMFKSVCRADIPICCWHRQTIGDTLHFGLLAKDYCPRPSRE